MKSKQNVERFKHKIKNILGNVNFNDDFKKHYLKLKKQENNLLEWCEEVKDKKIMPKPIKNQNIIVFIKKIGSSNRCVILKQKEGNLLNVI
jgi:hypothetical protein